MIYILPFSKLNRKNKYYNIYIGSFNNEKFNGKGEFLYSDTRIGKFKGAWIDGGVNEGEVNFFSLHRWLLGKDYSYHGREYPTKTILDKKYSCEIKIEGYYSPGTKSLHFNVTSFYWSKPLPYGLRWELGVANFKLFKNTSINDGFVLDGDIGGTKMILYSNGYTP